MDKKDNTINTGDASSERGHGIHEFRNAEAAEMYANMPGSHKFGYVSRELVPQCPFQTKPSERLSSKPKIPNYLRTLWT
jgi:hypothetical protein